MVSVLSAIGSILLTVSADPFSGNVVEINPLLTNIHRLIIFGSMRVLSIILFFGILYRFLNERVERVVASFIVWSNVSDFVNDLINLFVSINPVFVFGVGGFLTICFSKTLRTKTGSKIRTGKNNEPHRPLLLSLETYKEQTANDGV